MKKILFGFLAFSSVGVCAQVDFTLKASNKPSDSLLIANRTTKKWLVADKEGVFKSKLEVVDGFYQLKLADQYTNLYLKNGQDLNATLDYNKFDESLTYTGKGAKENNFLAQRLLNQSDKDYAGAMNAKDETSLTTEINKIKEGIFNTIPKDLDASFIADFKKNTEAQLNGLRLYVQKSFEVKKINNAASPTFNYENHKGGTTKLEDFKGKYVYIDVWATWCGPCRAEIPHLKNLEKEMHGKNVEFVSISIDTQKDHDKWKKFVDDKQLGGVQLMADKDWNSDFAKAFGINSIPRFILIGPDGKIVNADAPRPSSEEIKKLLNDLTKA
ncbi:TlpA family protein disulfide reductase [Flavobacterium sp.]|uniref:TlpA family protein disulfide reductase n=1 Tax=Flavobacterium sp. TaxID=239 RepID=UPI003D10DA31